MIKSTWDHFIERAKIGLMYCGSIYLTLDEVEKILVLFKLSFKVDRVYHHGNSSIALKKSNGDLSYIDRKGTVYKHGPFLIVHDKAKNDSMIIYMWCEK